MQSEQPLLCVGGDDDDDEWEARAPALEATIEAVGGPDAIYILQAAAASGLSDHRRGRRAPNFIDLLTVLNYLAGIGGGSSRRRHV
jgi:hypothetical protein